MKLNSVQNNSHKIAFKAETKKGNHYHKSHIGLAAAVISSSVLGVSQLASDVFKGQSIKTLGKPAVYAAGAVAVSAVFGGVIDFVFNKLRAKDADRHPMTLEQKFIRDLNSKDYVISYDSEDDKVVLRNKKDKTDRRPVHNVYTLKSDGSARVTGGHDHEINTNAVIERQDGRTELGPGEEIPFVEDNDFVKDIVDRAKSLSFDRASKSTVTDKEYNYSYDKENDVVVLSKKPAVTPFGIYSFDSYHIKPDGSISIITPDGTKERPIKNAKAAISIFDTFADVPTKVRDFKKALEDKENYEMYFNAEEHSLVITKKENLEGENKDKFTPHYEINNMGTAFFRYLENGDQYAGNSYIVLKDVPELKEMYQEYEKNASENATENH